MLVFDGIPGLRNDVFVADVAPETVEYVILGSELWVGGEVRRVGFEVEVTLDTEPAIVEGLMDTVELWLEAKVPLAEFDGVDVAFPEMLGNGTNVSFECITGVVELVIFCIRVEGTRGKLECVMLSSADT